MAAPITPRTELRLMIVGVAWQKRTAEVMRERLTQKIADFSLEWTQTRDPLASDLICLENKAINVLFKDEIARDHAYNQLMRTLALQYLEKGGDIQSLADALYGEAASEGKTAYIQLIFSIWTTLRSAFQQLPPASEQ